MIIQSIYNKRFVLVVEIDSAFISNYFEKDTDAAWGLGHYKSSKPKDKNYRKHGRIKRFLFLLFLLNIELNFLNIRVKGLQRFIAHAFGCMLGYLLKYVI